MPTEASPTRALAPAGRAAARRTALAVAAAACLLLGGVGCSSGGSGSSTASASASVPSSPTATASSSGSGAASTPAGQLTVTIQDFLFHPDNLTVAPGATITVTNQDSAEHTLTATTAGKEFDTGVLATGQSATITAPSAPGTYPFHCDIHPSMKGTLVVQ
ncbi:cupredoxin domain-containing protein [Kitasatospora sp. NBC_01560]|uniref:cupredoxin domain-containing protein n=1 Tax=Kitasatospora sp. NBC_01560 TaxID=2975965 RepID=UPI00386B6B53